MTAKATLYDTISLAITEALANTHTALIAKITSVGSLTINAQPVINRKVDGKSVKLPEFIEVPPIFLQGGGSYTAHPIAPGDYCLLIINERCFDKWYAGGDFSEPLEDRMHDYSDAFAIVGVNPQAGGITIPEVITQMGDTYQEGNYEHVGNRTQTGDFTITGNVVITGSLTVNGGPITTDGAITADGDITANGISTSTHVHTGVSAGPDDTGAPKP
jgi:hypothetical protein